MVWNHSIFVLDISDIHSVASDHSNRSHDRKRSSRSRSPDRRSEPSDHSRHSPPQISNGRSDPLSVFLTLFGCCHTRCFGTRSDSCDVLEPNHPQIVIFFPPSLKFSCFYKIQQIWTLRAEVSGLLTADMRTALWQAYEKSLCQTVLQLLTKRSCKLDVS